MIVGLTGLIGSGKSMVASMFAKCGAKIIDTDVIARNILTTGVIEQITQSLGKNLVDKDGNLDRQKLRSLVFANARKRILLERILHPLIFAKTLEELSSTSTAYTILVVPLLFLSPKYLSLTNRNLYVYSDLHHLYKRLAKRNSLQPEQVDAILATQAPHQLQLRLCDDKIVNNGSIDYLNNQVLELDFIYKNFYEKI